ncbi:hypothetical protein L208DRAFT_1301470, partial [Tricholoma matsutake]
FQHLYRSHLKTSTTLLNQKESGWKHDSLPWFWYMDCLPGDLQWQTCMMIFLVHHVNWLRAKAAFDRATEETTLVWHEMKWTASYFNH